MGQSDSLCISPLRSSLSGLVKSSTFNEALLGSGRSVLASERLVCLSSQSSGDQTSRVPLPLEPACPASCLEVLSGLGTFCLLGQKLPSVSSERLAFRAGLQRLLLQTSGFHGCSLPGEVVLIPPWMLWMESLSLQGHCSTDSGIFPIYLQGLKLLVPAVKGCRVALNYVFSLAGLDLSYHVQHLHSWGSCTFSFLTDFVVKTQNPSVPDPSFNELLVSSLDDFVGGNRDELLLCPIRALWKYLAHMDQFHLDIPFLFVSADWRKK